MSDLRQNNEEFIVFRLGKQEFCIPIILTREIRGWSKSTHLPNSPDYVMGCINLRGTILPIVDLAKRLGLESKGPSDRHVIIVAKVKDKHFGLLVESVSEILDVDPESLRPVPELDKGLAEAFFNQVIVLDNRIICEVIPEQLMPEVDTLAA